MITLRSKISGKEVTIDGTNAASKHPSFKRYVEALLSNILLSPSVANKERYIADRLVGLGNFEVVSDSSEQNSIPNRIY